MQAAVHSNITIIIISYADESTLSTTDIEITVMQVATTFKFVDLLALIY